MRTNKGQTQMAVVFYGESQSLLRDWLFPWFPKGKKSAGIAIRTHQGWARLKPDANLGVDAIHTSQMTNQGGYWLKGAVDPSAARADIALARHLMGWTIFDVSSPWVWIYRAFGAVMLFLLGWTWSGLAIVGLALAPWVLAIPSPCTMRGLYLFAQNREFVPPALRSDLSENRAPISRPVSD